MNHVKFKLTAILIFGLIIQTKLLSQETKKLSVNESIKIGLENSNLLHSSKMNVQYADAKWSEVNTFRLPGLSFNASYTRLSEVSPFIINTPFGSFDIAPSIFNYYNLQLSLRQPIFTGFKLESNSKMAEYNFLAAKQDYSTEEKNLIYNIKNAYWSLFKANQIQNVTEEVVVDIQSHLTDVQNLFEQGLATKNDVLKVKVQLGEVQLNLIDAKNAVKLANLSLVNLIGLPISTNIETSDNPEKSVVKIEDISPLLSKAYENRPELKSMNYRIKAGESGVTASKSDWWPQIYLVGDYYYSRPNQRIQPLVDQFNKTWDVGIALSFSLWNWGATVDRTDQAETQLEQAKDAYKIIRDGITLEVTQNYLNIKKSEERMTVAGQNVTQAEENYRVTDDKFKNGLALNSDLLDAEVALLQAKTDYIQSIVDYELAQAQLNKAIGE
jgi:outer membrane protein